jgi:DNA-binding CsgD family transcriptional regulator
MVDGQRFTLGGHDFAVLAIPRADTKHLDSLTKAEREVCQLVLAGLSNADIARARGCSPNTVRNQVASAYGKLGITSRVELAAFLG